jgi:hypothetical protein
MTRASSQRNPHRRLSSSASAASRANKATNSGRDRDDETAPGVSLRRSHFFGADGLTDALRDALAELRREIGQERLYVFALFTSGQSEFDYVCVSANTEEGLARIVAKADARGRGRGRERSRAEIETALRWSACDWEHHDFAEARQSRDRSRRSPKTSGGRCTRPIRNDFPRR